MPETAQKDTPLARLSQTTRAGTLEHLPVWQSVRAEDVAPGVRDLLAQLDDRLTALEAAPTPTWDGLMEPLEAINLDIGRVSGPINHLLSVKYSDEMQTAFDEIRPELVAFGNRLSQSSAIYHAMQKLRDSDEGAALNTAQKRILSEAIRSMERAGVHLEGDQKARYKDIQTKLADLSNTFRTNLVKEEKEVRVKATRAEEVAGIPAAVLEMAAQTAKDDGVDGATAEDGPWHFIVNGVNFAVVTHGAHRTLREQFYRAYRARGTSAAFDNRPVLNEIVSLRQEQAQLVGFDNYAELSVDAKMAPSTDAVWALLDELGSAARPAAEVELRDLVAFMREQGAAEAEDVQPWDVSYWSERLQEARYGYDSEAVRQYFQLPIVMQGLFALTEKLYGASIVPSTDAPMWDDDMLFFEVRQNDAVIAGFYLDPYARPGEKRGGAWMNIVVDRTQLLAPENGTSSLPVALLVMNARPPAEGEPALMSLDEVRTLFHEFGHATQLMFTEVEEGGASGLDLVEWDAVELASQFNEYWMDYAPFLKGLSNHVKTGEPMDDDLIGRIIDSANFMAGNATLRQLLYGKSDFMIHERYGTEGENRSPAEMEQDVAGETLVLPILDGESQLPAFGHLFAGGYAAGYYSYKWAEVLAADAFGAFEEVGLDNEQGVKEVASRFRETVLALGGSQPAGEIYRAFRGRDATPEALLRKQGLQ